MSVFSKNKENLSFVDVLTARCVAMATVPTILDESREKLIPPLSAPFNDGKMARFVLRSNSSLILGEGGGGG